MSEYLIKDRLQARIDKAFEKARAEVEESDISQLEAVEVAEKYITDAVEKMHSSTDGEWNSRKKVQPFKCGLYLVLSRKRGVELAKWSYRNEMGVFMDEHGNYIEAAYWAEIPEPPEVWDE